MKKILYAASVSAVLVTAFVVLYSGLLTKNEQQDRFTRSAKKVEAEAHHSPVESLELSTQEKLKELEHSVHEAENLLAEDTNTEPLPPQNKSPNRSSWEIDKTSAETPSIPLNDQVKSYGVVRLTGVQNLKPAVGDVVKVPLLNGQVLDVVVSHVHIAPNGDYIWSGHVQGFGDSYPVTMTIGRNSAYASITHSNGSYSMESVDELGWLYKNPSVAELSTNRKDYLEIPEHAKK